MPAKLYSNYLKKHGQEYDLVHDNQSLCYGMLNIQQRQPFVMTLHHPITSDLEIALAAAGNAWQRLLIRRWHSFLTMQRNVVQKLENIQTVSSRSKIDICEAFDISDDRVMFS